MALPSEGKWPQVAKHYDFRGISTSYHFHLLRCCTKGACRRLHRKKSSPWVRLCTKGACSRPHRKRFAMAAGSVRHAKTDQFSHFAAEVSGSAAWSESHARSMRAACALPRPLHGTKTRDMKSAVESDEAWGPLTRAETMRAFCALCARGHAQARRAGNELEWK